MPAKRLWIAAAILFAVIYWKTFQPSFAAEAAPVMRSMLAEQQVVLRVPEAWLPWLVWS